MPLVVSGNIEINTSVSEALTAGLASGTVAVSPAYKKTWANGSGAEQINQAFTKTATLAVSTPETLTLSNLADALGRTVPFTKIRELYLRNNGTADLLVGGAAVAPWGAIFGDAATDKLKVKPGGVLVMIAPDANGFAVAAGSSDQLMLDPGATACPYELVLLGV